MKKLPYLIFSVLLLSASNLVLGDDLGGYGKNITLSHGWNVVSTPAILSSIEFSNEGEGLSFTKLNNGQWVSTPATTNNVKPLEGFMVYNSNNDDVTMTLNYKTDVTPTQSILQRNLNYGWDLLGITTISSPFHNIGQSATMSVDFTNNGTVNYLNKVNNNYVWNSTSSEINTPQLGEAYGVFINQENAIYGGLNNGGVDIGDDQSDNPDCSDTEIVEACSSQSNECPQACKVSIEYTYNSNGNVVSNGVSDLDEIEILIPFTGTLTYITLQKYGYASQTDINEVRLEDEYGNHITNPRALTSNGKVELGIKNDYLFTTTKFKARIVVRTNNSLVGGQENMLGFKVTSAEINNNEYTFNDDYTPYQYNSINYVGSTVRVIPQGTNTSYHYESGMSYEVSKFRIQTSDTNMVLRSILLSNTGSLDLNNYSLNVQIETSDGEIQNVKTRTNHDNDLVIGFDDFEIPASSTINFTISIKINNLDKYGLNTYLSLKNVEDLRIREKTSKARGVVTINDGNRGNHIFEGGMVTISNTNLATTIYTTAGKDELLIGEGDIEIPEPIRISEFVLTSNTGGIQNLKLIVGGNQYDSTITNNNGVISYNFNSVYIRKSGKLQFYADIKDNIEPDTTISFSSFSKNSITDSGARYEDSRNDLPMSNIAGSISLSNVKISYPKGSLQNNITKTVEFLKNQTARKTIFQGTYTASKGDVILNGVALMGDKELSGDTEIEYFLTIDDKEVVSDRYFKNNNQNIEQFISQHETAFTNTLVNNGEEVTVKLEVEVFGDRVEKYSPTLILRGEDKDGNVAGLAYASTANIKVVEPGSAVVSESAVMPRTTVLVNDTNINLARFIVKASNNSEGLTLNSFTLTPTEGAITDTNDIRIRIAGTDLVSGDDFSLKTINNVENCIVVQDISEDIPSAGIDVEIILKTERGPATYKYNLTEVNGTDQSMSFSRKVLKSVAYIKSQENRGYSTTKFTFSVDKDSDNLPITGLVLFTDSEALNEPLSSVDEGTTLEVTNESYAQLITSIGYGCTSTNISDCSIRIDKSEFRDFFRVGGSDAQVFRTDEYLNNDVAVSQAFKSRFVNSPNTLLARFYVHPLNNAERVILDSFTLSADQNSDAKDLEKNQISILIEDSEIDDENFTITNGNINVTNLGVDIPSELEIGGGLVAESTNVITVEVRLKNGKDIGTYKYTLTNINGNEEVTNFDGSNDSISFVSNTLKSLAYIRSQRTNGDTTKFTFSVDKDSDNLPITGLVLFTDSRALNEPITVNEGTTLEVTNESYAQLITSIGYGCPPNVSSINECSVQFKKSDGLLEFFKIGAYDLNVYSTDTDISDSNIVIVESSVARMETVEVNNTNVKLAEFIVKAPYTEGLKLNSFTLTPTEGAITDKSDLRIRFDGYELSDDEYSLKTVNDVDNCIVVENLNDDIPVAGIDVEIILKTQKGPGTYKYTLTNLNGRSQNIKFAKKIVKSIVSIKSQENRGDSSTKFTFFVDKDEDCLPIKNLVLFTNSEALNEPLSSVEDGTTLELTNGSTVKFITAIAYTTDENENAVTTLTEAKANPKYIVIEKSEFRGFFKVGDSYAQIFRTK